MPELVLEIGTEELPASAVERAFLDLRDGLAERLREAGVLGSEGVAFGTPRRLIAGFPDLSPRQEDRVKELRGPAAKAAYTATGEPAPPLVGFCRSQGVEVDQVRVEGDYVWVSKPVPGLDTAALLAEAIPAAVRALSFDKTMRWGDARMRFARPIRWILAVYDGAVVNFDIEGVASGDTSRGHRFYAPAAFAAGSIAELLEGLRERFVEPDPERRRSRIAQETAEASEGGADVGAELLYENTYLTEWPDVVVGRFREEFLDLPEPVLVTAMAKHEKMFPVRGADGALENRFVFVRNSGEAEAVRKGAEWVLNARFNDAKFFFDSDRARSLDDFLEATRGIVFAARLGTVRDRADRLAALSQKIAAATGASPEEADWARLAGLYGKADLASGLVGELASLQGVVGAIYAEREGLPPAVCEAVAVQYAPLGASGATAQRLIVADCLDKLAGYLGLGLEPSGSSDPYALRRAASTLIEVALGWPGPLPSFHALFEHALKGYASQGHPVDAESARPALRRLMAGRYELALGELRHDVLAAAVPDAQDERVLDVHYVAFRSRCMQDLAGDTAFVQAASRPINIVAAAEKKGITIPAELPNAGDLNSPEGTRLLGALEQLNKDLAEAMLSLDHERAVAAARAIAPFIHAFFDTTMVMVDIETERAARLALLKGVAGQLQLLGDLTKIVVEG